MEGLLLSTLTLTLTLFLYSDSSVSGTPLHMGTFARTVKSTCHTLCWYNNGCHSVNYNVTSGKCRLSSGEGGRNGTLVYTDMIQISLDVSHACAQQPCKVTEICVPTQGGASHICLLPVTDETSTTSTPLTVTASPSSSSSTATTTNYELTSIQVTATSTFTNTTTTPTTAIPTDPSTAIPTAPNYLPSSINTATSSLTQTTSTDTTALTTSTTDMYTRAASTTSLSTFPTSVVSSTPSSATTGSDTTCPSPQYRYLKGNCTCNLGYNYELSTGTCMNGCPVYSDTFTQQTSEFCIKTFDKKHKDVPYDMCIQMCLEFNTTCISIEIYSANCYILTNIHHSVNPNVWANYTVCEQHVRNCI